MNAILVIAVLSIGAVAPYWSIAPDGSLIVVAAAEAPVVEPPRFVPVVIEEPVPSKILTRLPGPRHAGPHPGCLMCLGSHLIQSHGHDSSYLDSLGSSQWGCLHDNGHNTPGFRHGAKPAGKGSYGGTATIRRRLFGRFRR